MGAGESEEANAEQQSSEHDYSPDGHADCRFGDIDLDPKTCEFYRKAMRLINEAEIPFLVGGAYAMQRYTGISRHTKDFDIFVKPDDAERVLALLGQHGCETEMTFSHWLGKAYYEDLYVDVIFRSGNGVAEVDDEWFDNATADEVLGIPVKLCPPEEIIWTKAFVQERERYDGADIAHVVRAWADKMDWKRLLRRFGPYWRVLFGHLVLFGFVYPGERDKVPAWVMNELMGRLQRELAKSAPKTRITRGTIISRQQYLIDVENWGYKDIRLEPNIKMTEDEIAAWTDGIEIDGK
ncbi:MAG: nucleotidyltransferase family protein [Chloroflexota bacterium]|nr:nucleotidyltransferase family protein [Chloroflexota bacterium]MDQ5866356.1 nucleotidyltransferase family protein [Chloroflexota bacterium]